MTIAKTLSKFRYPDSIISENEHWYTLLRPEQITFSSIILICKNGKRNSFSQLNKFEQSDMFRAVNVIEKNIFNEFGCKKINYLALMMVDPFVHFHVIPRYNSPISFGDIEFLDPGFPGMPDLKHNTSISESKFLDLVAYIKGKFNGK
ncbi:MAG: HIT family protein [Candidatus Marinimicrobia bacterium]|nr:HIT family protein [Candidatus Neomarinimicrobiota bacterium]|tara:strand:+ start:5239 stop:5682 length:444 start_codon:yes stop_codon:yes gene_type:complete